MLYLIGLGLGDAKDITFKGLEVVRDAHCVYLESYTSILSVGKEALEQFYGREVIVADRDFVEQQADEMLDAAVDHNVAFLVVGDPLGATTHTDLILRAHKRSIEYKVIHNASIINAVGCSGLQLYHFGETVSIPFWDQTWKPDSFYDKINSNAKLGLHTLCLLDIKVKEMSIEEMMKGKVVYEPPRFMTVNVAAQQLLDIINKRQSDNNMDDALINENSICIAMARVGSDTQSIKSCKLKELIEIEMGDPLHCLVIPGKIHPLEMEMMQIFAK